MTASLIGAAALGALFTSRHDCHLLRATGATLLGVAALMMAGPAWADQTIMASDGAQVDCTASAKDLTRISLVGDEFASVSKSQTGNPEDDFSVVNEPVRGDIYLSVPNAFGKSALSFFGTSKRGYVYKFLCRIAGDQSVQIFVSNPEVAKQDQGESGQQLAGIEPQEAAVQLVQAMYANGAPEGYEMRQRSLRPVHVGALKVQMIAEYRGTDLTGRVLRIENAGGGDVELSEKTVAPASALAVSIAERKLGPGKVTTAYLVSQNPRALPSSHPMQGR
jgi:conjugal transfer pilus assembly protein TraK